MKNLNNEYSYPQLQQMGNGAKHVLTGMIVGGLIGATTMLFFAPRSGEEIRAEIRDKAMGLRDRTTDTMKDTVSQVKSKAGHLRGDVTDKAQGLKHKGQDILVEQLDRAAEALEAAKKAVEEF